MATQIFMLLLAVCAAMGGPHPQSKEDDSDLREVFRRARSEDVLGIGIKIAAGVEELVTKIENLSAQMKDIWDKMSSMETRMSSMDTSMSSVETRMSSVENKLGKVSPRQRVRLSQNGRLSESAGRVEVWHEGEWGTICDDGLETWDDSTLVMGITVANIVCKSLGYHQGAPVQKSSEDQQATGTIWIDEIDCNGDEESLLDCDLDWSYHANNCAHKEDFNVQCF